MNKLSSFLIKLRNRIGSMAAGFSVLLGSLCLVSSGFAQTAAHSPGWVVLPVDEYRKLHARAYPTDREPEPPSVGATLTRVDYDLRIVGELASGRASLTVDVLRDGWVRVPIPAGLLVREAKLDGKMVSLVPNTSGKSGGQLSALLSHSGRAVLLLDIVLPIASSGGEESLSLPSTASGITRAAIQLPRQGVDVRLTGGFLSENSEAGTESKWIAYGRGNEALAFNWKRKTEDHRATQALVLRGSLTQLLGLGEDLSLLNAEVNVEVTQGAAREVKLQIPNKVTVNQVHGAMVADWQANANELSVTFLEPVEQTARFVVSAETRSPRDGTIEIPLLRLIGAERETGGVAVEVLGAGETSAHKFEGMEEADPTDLGEMIASRQSQAMAAFRYRPGDAKLRRTLRVTVARYTPQAVLMANVEEARYEVLVSSEGKTMVLARYAVRNNQRNFLKITLPPGATLWSASLAGKAVRPGQAPDGSVLLPLDKAKTGDEAPAFAVEVVYLSRGTAWNDKGQFKLGLPALDLPVSRTGLLVYHPPLYKVSAEQPGTFRTEPYERPVSAVLSAPATFAEGRGTFAAGEGSAGGMASGAGDALSYAATDSIASAGKLPATPAPMAAMDKKDETKLKSDVPAKQAALDRFRADALGGKRAGILPIRVSFPAFGPSLYLVSELTGENQAPSAQFNYQHEKKAGGK